ncbi:hypothetical protein [Streptomyces specialis]|uniref:hypothetical protein n=1 Tax=Streptomyces specialis TaxID=498367 RepID=UPI00073F3D7E|nr:hypothetical protein [Streptomyces specialis]
MTPTFEDRLLDELQREVRLASAGTREEPGSRLAFPRARAGLGLAAAAGVAVTLVVLPGSGSSTAYAVEQGNDGTVRLTVAAPLDDATRNRLADDLAEAGVEVVRADEVPPDVTHVHCPDGEEADDVSVVPTEELDPEEWQETMELTLRPADVVVIDSVPGADGAADETRLAVVTEPDCDVDAVFDTVVPGSAE